MKRILVTGTSGLLGRTLVKALCETTEHTVFAATGHPENTAFSCDAPDRLHVVSNEEMFSEALRDWKIDLVINCAFARSNDPAQLASALDFTRRLVDHLNASGVDDLINISSQGVYKRQESGILHTESSEILPIDLYSMCKYATEQITRSGMRGGYCTNVRLSSLNMPGRFLPKFADAVKNGQGITLSAPDMQASLMDVRDAAQALVCMADLEKQNRAAVYNLGAGYQMSLLEYANVVKEVAGEFGIPAAVTVTDHKQAANAGMDCTLLFRDIHWEPRYSPADMVREMFRI